MNSCEFTLAITILAQQLASQKDPDEVTLLSAAFMQLADTLVTIIAFEAVHGN